LFQGRLDFISYHAGMDAQPELALLARVLEQHGLEAVLIGNMAAALHGAPVTTVDIDFFFRKTPGNLKKLKAVAKSLGAVILRPYYPVSDLFRLQRESDGLQMDFMGWIDGVKSYESVRGRASAIQIGGRSVLVCALEDIIRSKRAAGREKDRAVLDILEKAAHEKTNGEKSKPRAKTPRSSKGK
jgi:predicted nucleotidyltransferase